MEKLLSNHGTVMVEEMQYGPFICAYGIKLYDSDFKYDPDVDRMLDSMSDLRERKATLKKNKVPKHKQKPITDKEKTPDDIAMLFETTRVSS